MKNIFWKMFMMSIILTSCTKYNFNETGLSNGRFHGTMLEYMQANSYDWDSTVLMIKRGHLESLFSGSDPITFFGPTNHSIRRYMLYNNIGSVAEMDENFCKETLLRHVLMGKRMRENFRNGRPSNSSSVVGVGGEMLTMVGENRAWIYTFKESYGGVEGMGALVLRMASVDRNTKVSIASTDIEPDNGVVHALGYDFTLGEL